MDISQSKPKHQYDFILFYFTFKIIVIKGFIVGWLRQQVITSGRFICQCTTRFQRYILRNQTSTETTIWMPFDYCSYICLNAFSLLLDLTQISWIIHNATFGFTIWQYFSRMEYKTYISRSHAVINLLIRCYFQMIKIHFQKTCFKGFLPLHFIPQVPSILLPLSSQPTEYPTTTLTRRSLILFYWVCFYNFILHRRESLSSQCVQQLIDWFDMYHQQCHSYWVNWSTNRLFDANIWKWPILGLHNILGFYSRYLEA